MTIFPLLSRVFFWRGRRLYQIILNDKKLYGINLGHTPHFIEFVFLEIGFLLLSLILFTFVLALDLNLARNLANIFNLETFPILGLLLLLCLNMVAIVIGNLAINKFKPLQKFFIKHLDANPSKTDIVINYCMDLIKSQKEQEFINHDHGNFIIPIETLSQIELTKDLSVLMASLEIQYGQLKMVFQDGSKKKLLLSQDKYEELDKIIQDLEIKKDKLC